MAERNIARHCLASGQADGAAALVFLRPDGSEERWTYAELRDAVLRYASVFRALGVRAGDRVVLRTRGTPQYAVSWLAIIAAGGVAVPTAEGLTADEAGQIIAAAEPRLVVTEADLPIAAPVGSGVASIGAGRLAERAEAAAPGGFEETAADAPAYLIFTSGTTAGPKGVLHAQRSIDGRAPIRTEWMGVGSGDTVLHAGKLNWTYTLGVGLMDPLAAGATAVLWGGDNEPSRWPELIGRARATIFAAVPTVFRQILKYAPPGRVDVGPLRHGLAAGEPLPPAVAAEWRARTGTPVFEALGMTECSTYVSAGPRTPPRPGSPGRAQRGRRVAILPVDPAGGDAPLPVGEEGLLAVHRTDPGLMLGYWRRPDETRAAMRGEWFCGGDLGAFDDEGYLWFKGRANELMNAFGHRVSPLEVESVIARHPDVADVAVREARVREDVTAIVAYVVARAGAALAPEGLLAWVSDRIAPHKQPRAVVALDALPRGRNGKVRRSELPDVWRE